MVDAEMLDRVEGAEAQIEDMEQSLEAIEAEIRACQMRYNQLEIEKQAESVNMANLQKSRKRFETNLKKKVARYKDLCEQCGMDPEIVGSNDGQ